MTAPLTQYIKLLSSGGRN